jgi:GTP-binding protein HflX
VRDRITALERRIEALGQSRSLRRKQRNARGLPVLSIVGYTNAGKSTLLNALTDSAVLAEDKLFATLDPTSRRLRFPRDREVIITDTVGFIRDLPPDLVNAFRATLEELTDADVLLHVADASDPRHEEQIAAVEQILGGLGLELEGKRRVLVFNKADRLAPGAAAALAGAHRDAAAVSAVTREGLPDLLTRCERLLWADGLAWPAGLGGQVPAAEPPALEAPSREAPEPPDGWEPASDEPPAPRLLPSAIRRLS